MVSTGGGGLQDHSLPSGELDVTVCLGNVQMTQHCRVLDSNAFDIVIGTDFLHQNPQVKLLSLPPPCTLHCVFGRGLFSFSLSCPDEKNLVFATRTGVIGLRITSCYN